MELWSLILSSIVAGADVEPVRVVVGTPVTGTLGSRDPAAGEIAPPRRFVLDAGEDGPLSVSLESYDFDAALRVEDAAGGKLAQADGGGVETNARLTFDAKAGARYVVVAAARKGEAGEFRLSVVKGSQQPDAGDAAIEFRVQAAARALARGDRKSAARHLREEGNHRLDRSQLDLARRAYAASIDAARAAADWNGEALALASLGHAHSSAGAFPEARDAYASALAMFRELGDRRNEAAALGGLGIVYYEFGDLPRARESYEKQLAAGRVLGDRELEGAALANLAGVCNSLGDYGGAREHHERFLALARELHNPQWEATALGNLAHIHQSLGEFARARQLGVEQLLLAGRHGDRSSEGWAHGAIGSALQSLGDYRGAREHKEKALALFQEIGERPHVVRALANLGSLCYSMGDFHSAAAHFAAGRELSMALGDRASEGEALGNLGVIDMLLGDYTSGRERFEAALAISREVGYRPGEIMARGSLGQLHELLGDLALAREHLAASLALAREIGARPEVIRGLGSLASVHYSAGDYSRALACGEERLALARALGDRAEEAAAAGALGGVHHSLSDPARARQCFETHLSLTRELGNRAGEATALGNLSALALAAGDASGAAELARQSVSTHAEVGTSEDSLYPLATLARAALARRQLAPARAALDEAGDILVRLTSGRGGGQKELAGLRSRFASWAEISQDVATLAIEAAGDEPLRRAAALEEGFRAAGFWKGRSLLEGIAEHRRGGRTKEATELARSEREALARRDRLLEQVTVAVRAKAPSADVDALRAEARALASTAQDFARRRRAASPRDAALLAIDSPPSAELSARALGPQSALIEYAEGERQVFAYLLAGGRLERFDLGDREAMRKSVEAFLASIGDPDRLGGPLVVASRGKSLFNRLLGPILAQAPREIGDLVVVPSLLLAALPFEALVVAAPPRPASFRDLEFVVERYGVVYAPSSGVLLELAAAAPRADEGRALLLADPLYPAETDGSREPRRPAGGATVAAAMRGLPRPGELPRLEKSRAEAFGLARLLGRDEAKILETQLAVLAGLRSGSLEARRFDLHFGAAAARERLAGDLKGFGVIHLAAHGFVDRDDPRRTGLVLSFSPGKEDGYLTIADVMDLDLDARLVVLSACETARGEPRAGEGIESLARAFLYAGARSVIASLWKVSDEAAAETIVRVYRDSIATGAPDPQALLPAALRAAKIERANRRRLRPEPPGSPAAAGEIDAGHPFFWAPFIYVGLPR